MINNANKNINLPSGLLYALANDLGFEKNSLGKALNLDSNTQKINVAQWLKSNDSKKVELVKSITKAVYSLSVVVDINIMMENDILAKIFALTEGRKGEEPFFIIGEGEKDEETSAAIIDNRSDMASLLNGYLHEIGEVYEESASFTTGIKEFIVLLGICDLSVRLKYNALMEHAIFDGKMSFENVEAAIRDAIDYEDVRWSLPFYLESIKNYETKRVIKDFDLILKNLEEQGFIEIDRKQKLVSLSERALILEEAVRKSWCKMGIEAVSEGINGVISVQRAMFIKGGPFLWYFYTIQGKEEVVMAVMLSYEKAEAMLEMLLSPVEDNAAPKNETPTKADDIQYIYCSACGKKHKAGAKFCSGCGAKLKM